MKSWDGWGHPGRLGWVKNKRQEFGGTRTIKAWNNFLKYVLTLNIFLWTTLMGLRVVLSLQWDIMGSFKLCSYRYFSLSTCFVREFSQQEFSSSEYFENIYSIAGEKFFQKLGKTDED